MFLETIASESEICLDQNMSDQYGQESLQGKGLGPDEGCAVVSSNQQKEETNFAQNGIDGDGRVCPVLQMSKSFVRRRDGNFLIFQKISRTILFVVFVQVVSLHHGQGVASAFVTGNLLPQRLPWVCPSDEDKRAWLTSSLQRSGPHWSKPNSDEKREDDEAEGPEGKPIIIEDLSWRVEKLRLEEANTRRFLRAGPRYLPYKECCKWVQAWGNRWKDEEDWKSWIEMGEKRNAYIPARPDEYFGKRGEWISWSHFLTGVDDTEVANGDEPKIAESGVDDDNISQPNGTKPQVSDDEPLEWG